MGRFSSSKPMRPRSDRARRRVVFYAESLESRQLLSVATFHPTVAPALNVAVPAAFGPVVPTAAGNTGSNASSAGSLAASSPPVTVIAVIEGETARGFTEIIEITAAPSFGGSGTVGPIATGNAPSSPSEPSSPVSSSGSGSSGNLTNPTETSSTANNAITPLSLTVVSTPGAANRGVIIAVVAPQPIAPVSFQSSTIPVTTQAILNTATAEEQPLAPPVLGQGFESGQTQGLYPLLDGAGKAPQKAVPLEVQLPAIDYVEPLRPAIDQAPAAQPEEVPPAPVPARNPDAADAVPVEPAILSDWDKAPDFPILSPRNEGRTEAEAPGWSMAAMVGTAAIAGGGYHLVLGGSSRFNQRWLPTRRSANATRGRKDEEN